MAAWSQWISPEKLCERFIRAEFYSPEFLDLDNAINEFDNIKLSILSTAIYQGWSPKGGVKNENGIPAIKVQNLSGIGLDHNYNCAQIEKKQVPKRAWAKECDIYVIRCAHHPRYIGLNIDNYYSNNSELQPFITEKIIVARGVKEKIDARYVTVFLRTNYAYKQIQRRLGGLTANFTPFDFGEVKIPVFDELIHQYIGKKIKIAEICTSRASEYEKTACSIFYRHWEDSDVTLAGSFIAKTSADVLVSDRIDPEFYRSDLLSMREKIRNNKNGYVRIGKTGESFSGKTPSDKGSDDSLCEIVRVANLTSRGLNWSNRLFGTIGKSEKGLLKDGDIIVCKDAHQKYYIGQQVDIYCRSNHHAVASSETLVIRFQREHINPFAALIYLRSKEGYAAFQQQIRGTSAHLYPTDVEKIVVPKIPGDAEEQIEQLIRRAEHCRIRAYALTDEAKSDVEALIEDKLDTDAILSGKLKAPTWEDIEKELEGI